MTVRRLLLTSTLACSLGSCGGDSEPAADLGPQLLEAARAGDGTQVRALLGRGAEVESRDSTGATALVAATYGNYVDVARVLVGAGADVNAKDESEQSAYLIATSEVELMLANGAEVDAKDSYDGTGLIRAAERGHAAISGRLVETSIELDHVNRLGWTALLEAIILGEGGERHIEVVRRLVAAGADVDLVDGQGVTPLAHARRQGFSCDRADSRAGRSPRALVVPAPRAIPLRKSGSIVSE